MTTSSKRCRSRGLFGALVPSDFGGLDLTIPDVTEVVRTLSTYDASVGWTYAITSGAPLAGRMLSRSAFEDIFRDSHPLMSGSLNPTTGKAVPVEGGFRFSGTAMFASGCRHASWLMVGAWVQRDGEPSFTDRGPEFVAGVMPMDRVRINDTWSVTGMRATGSNDCTIDDVFVSDDFVFPWVDAAPRFETGTFGRIPLLIQFGPGLAATAVGAARGAQQRFIELATAKRPVGAITTLAERCLRADGRRRGRGLDPRRRGHPRRGGSRGVAARRTRGAVRQGDTCRVPHAPRDRGAARRAERSTFSTTRRA